MRHAFVDLYLQRDKMKDTEKFTDVQSLAHKVGRMAFVVMICLLITISLVLSFSTP